MRIPPQAQGAFDWARQQFDNRGTYLNTAQGWGAAAGNSRAAQAVGGAVGRGIGVANTGLGMLGAVAGPTLAAGTFLGATVGRAAIGGGARVAGKVGLGAAGLAAGVFNWGVASVRAQQGRTPLGQRAPRMHLFKKYPGHHNWQMNRGLQNAMGLAGIAVAGFAGYMSSPWPVGAGG